MKKSSIRAGIYRYKYATASVYHVQINKSSEQKNKREKRNKITKAKILLFHSILIDNGLWAAAAAKGHQRERKKERKQNVRPAAT